MARQQRPVYICDKCKKESLDSRDVRKFIGNTTDGEGKHNYVGNNIQDGSKRKSALPADAEVEISVSNMKILSNMYCLECIPSVLRLDETQEDRKATDLLKEHVDTTSANKLIQAAQEEIITEKKRTSIIPDEEEFVEVSQKLDDILDDFDGNDEEEFVEEDGDPIESVAEDSELDDIETVAGGTYHVLAKIKDEQGEELIATFYQFGDVKEMRDSYGGSLIGVYAGTGKYVDEIPECEYGHIKLLVNVIMGIPNVVDVECYADDNFAYVDKSYIAELMGQASGKVE